MPDEGWIRKYEEKGVSREEIRRRVNKAMKKREEAVQVMPALFRADNFDRPPETRAIEDRRPAYPAASRPAYVAPCTPPPNASEDLAVGRQHGLIDKGHGYWWCPCCASGVLVGHMREHVSSKLHMRASADQGFTHAMKERHARGEAPPYLKLVMDPDGRSCHEVCLLCNKDVTEGHLASQKHQNKAEMFAMGQITMADLEAWDQQRKQPIEYDYAGYFQAAAPLPTAPVPAIQDVAGIGATGLSMVPAVFPAAAAEPPLPARYGRREWYEWRTQHGSGWWYCLLCWKYADDSHIVSDNHRKRASCPECYLDCATPQAYMSAPQLVSQPVAAPLAVNDVMALQPPPPPPPPPPPKSAPPQPVEDIDL
mmetsp:Transcript_6155/g.10689  ORF Transcript_6155/g.10689 Transcript_6155/m.10689 type:complete len:367 (+) Transcript_6155:99-1199(+)